MKYFLFGVLLIICIAVASVSYGGVFPITLAWEGCNDSSISYLLFRRAEGEQYDYNNPIWANFETTCTVDIPYDEVSYFVVRAFDAEDGTESADSNEVKYTPEDSDADGLVDAAEGVYGTDPDNPDSDGDGYLDGDEVANGGDPMDPDYGPAVVVYEDAEDGTIDGWVALHKKAKIENVYDEYLDSLVIKLHGKRKFIFTGLDGNKQLFVMSCRIWFERRFAIVVTAVTESGETRIFIIKPGRERIKGRKHNVKIFLGKDLEKETWHTITRDLQADLSSVQPDQTLAEITGIYIKTYNKDFKIDDLKLMRTTLQ